MEVISSSIEEQLHPNEGTTCNLKHNAAGVKVVVKTVYAKRNMPNWWTMSAKAVSAMKVLHVDRSELKKGLHK
ncbi:unnamed protein product [Bursaphelenchus xylophilus]|uniref:(pine wood nematode) hypothetical protein n=1 Tax=Bursaphelenchus xylophilus TaxID=6326 RepID=A0A811LX11_BURXY|nr:unnamed protein product [Bursaphelenchus xylophilus]CAG9125336.1 unnamed protein product [Bursaphelenchus xylophilus]